MRIDLQSLKNVSRVWICCVAVLHFAAHSCFAQRYSFHDYAEGLGNLVVNSVVQDRTGYLWVGTENGLYRYDGVQFRQYGAASGLHAHTIQNLYLGMDGTLWVGTTAGIYFKRRDGAFSEVRPPATIGQFSQRIGTAFTAMAPDRVVTADRSGAFLLRSTGADQWIAEPMHLESSNIWSVLYGPGNVLWYGCGQDICRLADDKTTHLGAALGAPKQEWRHLLLARDGSIWLRGQTHLGQLLPSESRFELHDLPGQSNAVVYVALVEDGKGRILASQGPNFGLWNGKYWQMVTARNGLSRNDISVLFIDREGSVWIAVVGHGLRRWLGQDHWEGYTVADGLSDDIVWAALRDRNGRLWIGTESGLDYIPAGGSTPRAWHAPGIRTVRAYSLAESADGSIWMGSAAGNLIRIDANKLTATQWKIPEVYRILTADAADSHRLWMATGEGLYVMDTASKNSSPHLMDDPAITDPRQRFTDLSLDSGNHLWAASTQGLLRLDGTGWHRIDPGISTVKPIRIATDRQGYIWASGDFPGVMRLRIADNRIVDTQHITHPHLLSEQVVSIFVDHRGWVWMGQDSGLTVYDGSTWRSLTQEDGLLWNDTDAYALAEDKDGSLWIGTSGGLSHFMQPQNISTASLRTPVFSQIAFGGTPVVDGAQIPWSASPLTISIALLSFQNEWDTHIRYRLLGLESDWVETAQKNLRYPRLDPGAYRLQVMAVNDTGCTVSAVKEIAFRIEPQWWQSWWLKLALVLLAALMGRLLWIWRLRRLIKQKRQLEQAVKRRTEDLEREKTELLYAREQMRHYAEHDHLTGLWNHRVIINRLRSEVERSQRNGTPMSVILVDLDHFKHVNDTFGHPSGDMILKEVGAIFQHSVRSYDWVGRYGGEEFLLVLPGSGFLAATSRAEEMRATVQAAKHQYEGTTIQITASFGVASGFPSDFEAMLQAADTALYRAKNNGRNCVMVTEIDCLGNLAEKPGQESSTFGQD